MDQYPPNTKSTRGSNPAVAKSEEKPEITKVVTGEVTQRKRAYSTRFKEMLVGGAGEDGLVQSIWHNVIFPAGQDLIAEAGMSAVEGMVFRGNRGTHIQRAALRQVTQGGMQVAYNRIAGTPTASSSSIRQPRQPDPRPQLSQEARRSHNFGEFVLATRPEALEVIRLMNDLITRYDSCSVSDLYKMLGENPEFTDESWGWDRLDGAGVQRDSRRGGYVLVLPRPEPLA